MSKKALTKYLKELDKEQLEEQVLELYDRLKEVKEFYNFVFNPKEDKMLDEAKFKIYKEYFPPKNRKAKKRRSVAQNFIKNFIKLGVDPKGLSDLMLYNMEVAILYNSEKRINQETFYKSILRSFREAVAFIDANSLGDEFNLQLEEIVDQIHAQEWENVSAFEEILNNRF